MGTDVQLANEDGIQESRAGRDHLHERHGSLRPGQPMAGKQDIALHVYLCVVLWIVVCEPFSSTSTSSGTRDR